MRKIKLTKYKKPILNATFTRDTLYCVYLGNSRFVYFKSEKTCQAFLADTNRFLNNSLQILNQLYIQIFGEYREIWFLGDVHDISLNDVAGDLKAVDDAFMTVFIKATHPENGNHYSFLYTESICKRLITIITTITDIYDKRKIYVTMYKLKHISFQLETMLHQLENYGKPEPQTNSETEIDFTDLKE